jgi:hypothetical protein
MAFNQSNNNYQAALNKYKDFNPINTNSNSIPGLLVIMKNIVIIVIQAIVLL